MARIPVSNPGGFRGAFRHLVAAINANFEELYSGGSSYSGDPTVINQDATHRFTTDEEKTSWNSKAAGSHTHDYAASSHNHDLVYSPLGHTHPGSSPQVATLAGNQATGANVTPVTLMGLVFSYEANSKYRIWFMGRVQPVAATTGCGFQFDLSDATGVTVSVLFFHQLANTGTLSGGHSIADDASVGVSSGLPATSTYPVTGHGLLISTTNAGTAQLRLRSETTAVITAKAGFTLVVEKL